jgi:hypothetical protein
MIPTISQGYLIRRHRNASGDGDLKNRILDNLDIDGKKNCSCFSALTAPGIKIRSKNWNLTFTRWLDSTCTSYDHSDPVQTKTLKSPSKPSSVLILINISELLFSILLVLIIAFIYIDIIILQVSMYIVVIIITIMFIYIHNHIYIYVYIIYYHIYIYPLYPLIWYH